MLCVKIRCRFISQSNVWIIHESASNHCKNIAELKNVVLNRQFTVEVAPDLHERVSEAVRLKAIAKEKLQEIVE